MNCKYCNKEFTPKSKRHKFCRNACRVNSFRQENGIAKPEFLQNYQKKKYSKPKTIDTTSFQVNSPNTELQLVENSIAYYQQTLANAEKGLFPAAMVSLAGLGYLGGKEPLQKFGLSVIGGLCGHLIDAKRKENLIRECKQNLKQLKSTKSQLQLTQRTVRSLLENNKIEFNGVGYKSVMKANDYKTLDIKTIGIDKNSQWYYLFGDPQENFAMMLHGLPGNGKSTLALKLADYFQNKIGDVLFIASEQHGTSKSLQDNLRRNTKTNFSLLTDKAKQTMDYFRTELKAFKLVVLDSVNSLKLSADDLEELRAIYPNTAFIVVMQSTKDGNFKGSQEWAHNPDIVIHMDNFKANQTKSRFASPATILIE